MEEFKFSDLEQRIINLLREYRSMLTSALAAQVYKDVEDPPLNKSNSVLTTIRQINKKTRRHELGWFIDGEGLGRNGKTIWIETD